MSISPLRRGKWDILVRKGSGKKSKLYNSSICIALIRFDVDSVLIIFMLT